MLPSEPTRRAKVDPNDTTNVSVSEVDMLENSPTLAVSVPINLSIKLGFVSVNGKRKLTFWTRDLVYMKF